VTDDTLVIGYGNELRRDDGAGPRVARAIEALKWAGVRSLAVHQLSPELAEPVAGAGLVIFVDAASAAGAPSAQPVVAGRSPATLGHASDPGWLLALTKAVYGRRPTAWLVSVPVPDTGYGIGLSRAARRGVREAVDVVRQLVREGRPCMR
jgi:hydrogenase maturation protease